MAFLIKNKRKLVIAIMIYSSLVSAMILLGSFAYREEHPKSEPCNFNEEWEIKENGESKGRPVQLPYVPKSTKIHTVDIYNQIPNTPFSYPSIELSLFQTTAKVYIDNELIFEKNFEQKYFNQTTPGSGSYRILLPKESEGKILHINIQKAVEAETININQIVVQEGIHSTCMSIMTNGIMFFVNVLMLTLGIALLSFAVLNQSFKERRVPLLFLALFFITETLWFLCNSKMIQCFTDNTVLIHNLEYLSLYLIPISMWSFVRYNWKRQNKVCQMITHAMIAFFVFAITLKITGIADFFILLKPFHVLCLINVIVFIVVVYQERRVKGKSKSYFYIGLLIWCLSTLIGLGKYYVWYSNALMDQVYAVAICMMFFFMMMSFLRASQTVIREGMEGKLYQKLALTDTLTGIGNRLACDTHMRELETEKKSAFLVMMDVNGLKSVNDQYGHQAGDRLIKTVAEEIQKAFIQNGYYRMGGDEFCVILENVQQDQVEQCLKNLKEQIELCKEEFPIAVACGFAEYAEWKDKNVEQVLKEADDAMYENKKQMKIMDQVMNRVEHRNHE